MSGKYTVFSYAHLYNGARAQLQQAQAEGAGSFYCSLSAMLLAAFSVEAYFNHLGPIRFRYWDSDVKRGTNVKNKIKLLSSDLRLEPDDAKRLLQSVAELTRFRNRVAHADTESHPDDSIQQLNTVSHQASWERDCNPTTAERYLKLAEGIIETLHERAGLEPPALGLISIEDSRRLPRDA